MVCEVIPQSASSVILAKSRHLKFSTFLDPQRFPAVFKSYHVAVGISSAFPGLPPLKTLGSLLLAPHQCNLYMLISCCLGSE